MKLSEIEKQEKLDLEGLQNCITIPMSKTQVDRLKYLQNKQWHNCCPNPRCEGYEGTDNEFICLKCSCKLVKSI